MDRTFLIFLRLDSSGTRRRHETKRRHDGSTHLMTLSKNTSMLGRGVKRKWSCLEELEAEMVPAAAEKEKNGEEDKENEDGFLVGPSKSDMTHLQQRQLVLGLCLEKLQHYQAGVELSLRRSVLLINTLKQIQEDMQSDGVETCPPEVLLNGVHTDSCLLRDDFREDMPVTCPGCAEDDEDNLSPPLSPEFPSQEANSSPEQQKSLPAATVNAFSDAVNAMGYLSDLALDDIFEDIDTSMYETSDLPSAWSAGSLWPVSVSLWADEDVKMRSSNHASAGSLQSCLTDLNELDHIMEILVKS
ncbi:cell division cycle-associated protein 4 isoform X1 [Dicentrarchus labrax]|uniref:cell division cycle-associated protein 4 isoform X1 n=1 Tax=Dicentrarchus labrax TaxID=13489 RepID=UPI0021F593B9|nr:cell division cycle-associated protein 4 isoform X1 [Dicentrarchus labrax]